MPEPTLMPPLSRKQRAEFRKLSDEEKRDYLRARLHDEAEVWLDYFMRGGVYEDLLGSRFLLHPPQR